MVKTKNSRRNRERGFTLIELIVVVTIVGLLAGIAVVNVLNAQRKTAETILKADLALLRKAIDDFYADRQRFPASLQEMVDLKYLRKLPLDPITKSADTWVEIRDDSTSEDDGGSFSTDAPAEPGIADVKSGAEGSTMDNVPYGDL